MTALLLTRWRAVLGLAALALALLAAAPARPESEPAALPVWEHTSLNDFAGVLTDADAEAIDRALIALHEETGIEGTVVTLTDRARYGGADGLEPFATRLFNAWGVGDKTRQDGFLMLFLRDDREVRIELGRGYSRSADIRAQDVISRVMVPAFRAGATSRGLREGTQAVIDTIARPQAGLAPTPAAARRPAPQTPWAPFAIFGAAAAGMIGLANWRQRRRDRCPQCGHQGLERQAAPLRDDLDGGGWVTARQTVTRRCPACGWQAEAVRPMSTVTHYDRWGTPVRAWRADDHRGGGVGSGGFGGGSSSGGGASGRW